MLIKIYETNNAIEANLLKDILEQEGISAQVYGEYLQGGIGELPAMGLVSIMVETEDQLRAEEIIRNWEQGAYKLSE